MKKNRAFIYTLILIFVALVGSGFTWLKLEHKQINGIVLNTTSGRPISSAVIEVGQVRVQSDRSGHFSILVDQTQGVSLQATASGYLPLDITFDLPWYLSHGKLNINLAPDGFPLKLVDSWTDEPLEDVSVMIANTHYRTDDTGLVLLDSAKLTAPVLITIDQPGYLLKQFKLNRLPDSSTELPFVVELEPHIFNGTVMAGNKPATQVTVKAGEHTLQTDDNGHFTLARLVPGERVVVQPLETFMPVEFFFEGQLGTTIHLTPNELMVNIIDGLSGGPVADALVEVQGANATTDSRGQATLQHIAGQGAILVSHAIYQPTITNYQVGQRTSIVLNPKKIRAIVSDAETGQPLTHTRVVQNHTWLQPDEAGVYQLTNRAQQTTLSFNLAGYRPAKITFDPTQEQDAIFDNVQVHPCPKEAKSKDQIPCFEFQLQPFSAKAVYVPLAYLTNIKALNSIFQMVEQTELNAVILDVKADDGRLAWDSQVELANQLKVDGNRAGWMTLETFIEEARKRDIYTIARMVIFKDTHLAKGMSDLAVIYPNGVVWQDTEGSSWANPLREEVWAYNIALAEEIAALGFDEINMDYIRFPSDGDIGAVYYGKDNTPRNRTTAIRTFARRMQEAIAPYGTSLSADVFGLTVWVDPNDDMNIGQRVIDIAPYVDYIAPMIYPSTFIPGNLGLADPSSRPYEVIYRSQQAAQERMPPTTKVRPWLQAYWYSTTEMLLQKQAANDANSAGWFWWNAAGIYDDAVFEPVNKDSLKGPNHGQKDYDNYQVE